MSGTIGEFNFFFTLGYTGYFILGYVLNKISISKKTERAVYLLGLLGFLGTVFLSCAVSYLKQSPDGTFHHNLTVNVLLESMFVFVFAKKYFSMTRAGAKMKRVVVLLSKYSFGAYLVHDMVIHLLKVLGLNTLAFNPLLSVPIISITVFMISYFISAVLNHIPILKKYVV